MTMKHIRPNPQRGLFDRCIRLAELSDMGDPLERLDKVVDWMVFQEPLGRLPATEPVAPGGRPSYEPLFMFKVLVIQFLYHLGDAQVQFQITDRHSFKRFLGMSDSDKAPDEKTIWLFRERIRKAKLEHPLFEAFKGQLMKEGMIARRGRIIDATFVDVPRQRNKREENEQIKNGNVPDTWKEKSPAERRQKDLDARWTKKNNEVHYGYKNHVQVDRESKLVVDFVVTDASVHDSQALEQLVKPGDPETWVDSGYAGVPCEEIFKACEVKGHIIDRAYRNKPLTEAQKRKNRKKSQVRVRVEHVFGTMCMTMCAGWNRCIGMARNYLAISMTNLIYNLVRFEQIKRLNLKKWRTC
jgi:transposase, IS5 family